MNYRNLCISLLLLCVTGLVQVSASNNYCDVAITGSDTSEYYNLNYVRNTDFVYQTDIHGITISRTGFALSDAIITLGSGESIYVGFDQLNEGFIQYYFKLKHCNADWATSEIWENEYLEGIYELPVEDFISSFNTLTPYTHYSFTFPNDNIKITKSGNYILYVYHYDQKGTEIPAFTRRVLVVDPKVNIEANISRASTSEDFETKQEVDFAITTGSYRVDAPFQDIKVTILQNGRWDNALTTLKPLMVRDGKLDYTFDNGINLFDGANEFRFFDLKSIRLLSERVREITHNDTTYMIKLWNSERRTFKEYVSSDDINGKFLLKTDDEPAVENYGEYAYVQFFLPYDAPVVEGNLYVAGAFNGWQYTAENKMEYNFKRKGYEASILLKQGYYNYLYVLLPSGSQTGDATWVEGNHSQTRNSYTILVYHRNRGDLYDQLIGVGDFNLGKK